MGLWDIVKKGVEFIPGVGPVASTALDVGGALMNKRAADAQGNNLRDTNIAAGQLAANKAEDTRLANVGLGSSMAGDLSSRGFVMPDAETLRGLGERRDYTDLITKAAGNPNAGSGSAFLAGLFNLGSEAIGQHEMNQDAVPSPEPMGVPASADGVGTAADPALQGSSVPKELTPFRTGLDPNEKKYEMFGYRG